MKDLIYQKKNSIPDLLCEKIIELFEEQDDKVPGSTLGGINKKVKDTTDYVIPKNDELWKNIEIFLYKELNRSLKQYKQIISTPFLKNNNNYNVKFNIFEGSSLFARFFMIQKYDKNKGKYIYHNDFKMSDNSYRAITFLWYLNTVDEGGETEFWNEYKIKPEQGKLVLFPASWTHPHCGKTPESSNKYIITGWLYEKFEN